MPDYAQLLLAALEPEPEEVLVSVRNRLAEVSGEIVLHIAELDVDLLAEQAARQNVIALCNLISSKRMEIARKQEEKTRLANRLVANVERAAVLDPLREKIYAAGVQPVYTLTSSPLSIIDFTRPITVINRQVKFETLDVQLYHEALDALFPSDDTQFGPFAVTVELIPYSYGHTLNVRVAPGADLSVDDLLHHHGYIHPHVEVGGRACLGDYTNLISSAMESSDILAVLYLTCKFLRHYNPASPYARITKFGIAERDPWSTPYCAECKHQLHLCSCVIETYEWCPGCLGRLPTSIPACGWCPTCCAAKHEVAPNILTALLSDGPSTPLDVGLNGSSCVLL